MTSFTPTGFRQRLGNELAVLASETATAPGHAPAPAPRQRPWATRRRLSPAVAGVAGVAAAGAALTAVAAHHPTDDARATRQDATSQLQKITTVSYTVQRRNDGRVRLAVTNPSGRLLDTAGLQRDLNRLGVPAVVYAGDPECTRTPTGTADASPHETWRIELTKGGKPVLSVRPDRIPAGQHLLVAFPLVRTDPDHGAYVIQAGKFAGAAPSCVPALSKGSTR